MRRRAGGRLDRAARNLEGAVEVVSRRMLSEARSPESATDCRELSELAKIIRQAADIDRALSERQTEDRGGEGVRVEMDAEARAYSG